MKNALCLSVLLHLLGGYPTSAWAPAGIASRKNHPLPLLTTSASSRLYISGNLEQEKSSSQEKDKTSDSFLSASGSSTKNWKEPIPYSELTIGVLKETFPGENRVSQTPDSVQGLIKAGFTVVVEAGAGENASFSDAAFVAAGAVVLPGKQVLQDADIITKI